MLTRRLDASAGVRVPPPPPLKPKPEDKDDPFYFYKTYKARTIKRGEPLAIYAGTSSPAPAFSFATLLTRCTHRGAPSLERCAGPRRVRPVLLGAVLDPCRPEQLTRRVTARRHVYSLLKRSYIYDLDSWTSTSSRLLLCGEGARAGPDDLPCSGHSPAVGEEMRALAPPRVANRLVVSKQDSAHKSTTQPAATSGKGKKKKPGPTRLVEGEEDDDDDESFTSLYSIDAFNMGNVRVPL